MTLALGIVGTLLGVVIGAFLTRWIDFAYERRREVRQAIASALVLYMELEDTKVGAQVIREQRKLSGSFLFPGLEAWDQHRENLLSAGMKHRDWIELARIFRQLLETTPLLKMELPEAPDAMIPLLEELEQDCEEGIRRLKPFVVEGQVPFLSPKSIFEQKTNRG